MFRFTFIEMIPIFFFFLSRFKHLGFRHIELVFSFL